MLAAAFPGIPWGPWIPGSALSICPERKGWTFRVLVVMPNRSLVYFSKAALLPCLVGMSGTDTQSLGKAARVWSCAFTVPPVLSPTSSLDRSDHNQSNPFGVFSSCGFSVTSCREGFLCWSHEECLVNSPPCLFWQGVCRESSEQGLPTRAGVPRPTGWIRNLMLHGSCLKL